MSYMLKTIIEIRAALARILDKGEWDEELVEKIRVEFQETVEASRISISKIEQEGN